MFVFIGLAVIVGSIVLIVQASQTKNGALRRLGGLGVAVGVVIALFSSAFVVIPAGRTGVVFNVFGGVQDRELGEGFHIVLPFLQQVTQLDTRKRSLEFTDTDQISALSKEGLQINADATIIYSIIPSEASKIYQTVGTEYEAAIIRPTARAKIRDAIASFNAAELISSRRQEVQSMIIDTLSAALAENNILLEDSLLRDIRIPPAISQAIEEKQAAEQQVQVEANRREQSRIAAERAVIEAEGQRDAEIARAQGEAQALSLRGEAIRKNPEIIQLEIAQKLAPSLQTIMLPSDGNFLLDVRGLMGGQTPSQP